jgi:uncharacterized protein YkwD
MGRVWKCTLSRGLGAPAVVAASAAVVALLATAGPARALEAVCAGDVEREVARLVNVERAAYGLAAVKVDVRLGAAAVRHSADMRDHCFLSHTGSDGSQPTERVLDAGYPEPGGEVAAAGGYSYDAAAIVASWMGSSGHRAILLRSDAKHVGVGYTTRWPQCSLAGYGFAAGGFWVANFGKASTSTLLEENCCSQPEGEPVCVPEPGAAAAAAAATLGALARRKRTGRAWTSTSPSRPSRSAS